MDDLWNTLSVELKKFIKDALLNILISENKIIMKSTATSIAIIASIEVPEG